MHVKVKLFFAYFGVLLSLSLNYKENELNKLEYRVNISRPVGDPAGNRILFSDFV